MDALRRKFLQGGTATAVLLPLLGLGALTPRRVLAAGWNRPAFTATSLGEALKAYGAAGASETRDIVINAPDIAENGAKVDIDITSNLPGTRSIAVFAEKNRLPLCAAIDFSGAALPFVRLQLKLAETTRVRAIARTMDGKNHVASREIKVTLGGCG
jgi:sulfur-oxidizing protein SoxY